MTNLKKNLKKNLLAFAAVLAALGVAFATFLLVKPDDPASAAPSLPAVGEAQAVRADSHRLTNPQRSEMTLVEFLDFECESCGAVHPTVEKLRQEYGDRVTFVVRYFPLPGHRNSRAAAVAVEASAQQGKFEDMYKKMFATQKEWGESQNSQADVFRGYAEQLGLDMQKYDAAVKDPATEERVKADQRDGMGLNVQGTPTFFLDGRRIQTPRTYEAFKALIDERLAQ
ncbi:MULTISPECIES: thioredoxin domain-containing protein [unclassified Streptomyces]|uniref:DsbA family protein n=1 Tax=unclassified Streptomyces TaxID=2593676 RepID=UPI000DC78CCE|nr:MULTISPECIES: thioredoxin domain-containing protein [unclassified Streptomyces]AWZ05317.1 disulfide bond formation protein DsbA [Streptomyces sp. ICC4]AWZ11435.1 disulfide bond formation protein DsbA [Streptomyces sp. ICC1]